MYKASVFFTDAQDNGHKYNVGDIFPRVGLDVSPERIAEMLGNNNKRGIPVIEEVIEIDVPQEIFPVAVDKPKRTRKRKTDAE